MVSVVVVVVVVEVGRESDGNVTSVTFIGNRARSPHHGHGLGKGY